MARPRSCRCKRAYDLAFVALVTILFPLIWVPAWVIVPALILVTMGRPVLYVRDRVGMNGQVYKMYKFRTMTNGGDTKVDATGTAKGSDPRITKLGHILRRSSLDEAPQVINILRGEMSVVGPRPWQPEYMAAAEEAAPGFSERLAVRPGIAGLDYMRTRGDNAMGIRKRLRYDRFYIERVGVGMDTWVIWRSAVNAAGLLFKTRVKR